MRASIIIAAHNEGEALWKTVRACIETCAGLDYEIVIADDASVDDSVAEVQRRFPRLRIVRHEERRGASPTKDRGAREARGDVLVFLDGHCNPEQGAITRLVQDVEEAKGTAILTPAIAGLDVQSWRNSSAQIGHGYFLDLEKFDCGWLPLSELRAANIGRRRFYESPALIGCALAVSRELYEDLWGFDRDMRLWGVEDLDFGLKAWLMGHPILHDAESVIGHRFRASFDNYEVPVEHTVANQLRMARKNFTHGVWSEWLDRCRMRHPGRLHEHPEGLWARVWKLFEEQRASVEQERAYLHARRVRDEFWYAERFGLTWPRLRSAPTAPAAAPAAKGATTPAEQRMTAFQASPSPSPPPGVEWKAWPGGQKDTTLNPTESFSSGDFGFTGNIDWDVGQGGVKALIVETGTTTATDRASITVRYDTKSPSAEEKDTAFVQAKKGDTTKTKKRTIFSVSWSLKFADILDADDNLRFPRLTGTQTNKCEFNWNGERGSDRVAGKMEATLSFSPIGIDWKARGVTFKFSKDGGGAKYNFRLHRKRIWQNVGQPQADKVRIIQNNDADWVYDGESKPGDTQYPTAAKPDKAFRIDYPGFDATLYKQKGFRGDLRERAEWHNGTAWTLISNNSEGAWFFNGTSVLPDGAKGGTNNDGAGTAENVPNTRPVALALADETVNTGAKVELDGSASSDADHDPLTYKWTQTAGTKVVLSSDTSVAPTFTAPKDPTTLKFSLVVTDITTNLHHHKPDNSASVASTVTITVKKP